MTASGILAEARRRAGLSQRGLAELAGTAQSVVARIESGLSSPTWDTLSRLVEATGLLIEARVRMPTPRPDALDAGTTSKLLDLTPRDRIAGVDAEASDQVPSTRRTPLNAPRLLEVLATEGVRHVVIGAVAARLYGSPRRTSTLDLMPALAEGNVRRLAAALRGLDARLHVDGIPDGVAFDLSAETLERAGAWQLASAAGRIALRFDPAGIADYATLEHRAERFWVGDVPVAVASLDDLMLMKDVVDRPADRVDHAVLQWLRSRRAKP